MPVGSCASAAPPQGVVTPPAQPARPKRIARNIPSLDMMASEAHGKRLVSFGPLASADPEQHAIPDPAGAIASEMPNRGDQLRAHRDDAGPGRRTGAQPVEPAPQPLAGEAKLHQPSR